MSMPILSRFGQGLRSLADRVSANEEEMETRWSPPASAPPLSGSFQPPPGVVPAPLVFPQWFERDPERWQLELDAMKARGFEAGVMRDGRVVFLGSLADPTGCQVAVVCDWLYPLKPPAVFVEQEPSGRPLSRAADGAVDVLALSVGWSSEQAAVTVLDLLEEALRSPRHSQDSDLPDPRREGPDPPATPARSPREPFPPGGSASGSS